MFFPWARPFILGHHPFTVIVNRKHGLSLVIASRKCPLSSRVASALSVIASRKQLFWSSRVASKASPGHREGPLHVSKCRGPEAISPPPVIAREDVSPPVAISGIASPCRDGLNHDRGRNDKREGSSRVASGVSGEAISRSDPPCCNHRKNLEQYLHKT